MFADLLFKRPIALPKGRVRVIQDGMIPEAVRINNASTYSAEVRQRIMALFDEMESITVPIICGEIGFTAASANRHIARLQSMGAIVKCETGRRGSGRFNTWVRGTV